MSSLSLSPLADDEAYALYHGDASSTSPSTSLRPKRSVAVAQAHNGGGIHRESRKSERITTKMDASASLFERVGGLPVISRFQR